MVLQPMSSLLEELSAAQDLTRPDTEWTKLIDFANSFCGGMLAPMQITFEVMELLKRIEVRQPKTILEIGTARGGTLFLFTRAAHREAYLVSLDLPNGQFGGELVTHPSLREMILPRMALPRQTMHFLRGNSHIDETYQATMAVLAGRNLDVLFIDGDHSYDGVKADFEMYKPVVSREGIVAFHDVAQHSKNSGCEVSEFWSEVKHSYRHEEIIENSDQGWAGVGILYL
jgi:predicted O-methyltransferase YrrM